jgi:predicted porin
MKQQCIRAWAATALLVLASSVAPRAHAIDLMDGDWKLSITGNVNGSFIYSICDKSPHLIVGSLACVSTNSSASVSNGLLPAAITFNGSTTQSGYDLGFTFGFYPGITTNDGGSPNLQNTAGPNNVGLGTTGLDIRQVFLTFGNDTMGTVMVGRNIGLFQADAILNDMTLIGVGAGNGNYAAPPNTSLGSIGLGYIYPDWFAQLNYTTPDLSGFKLTAGTFAPFNTLASGQPVPVSKGTPGFQGKIAWTGGSLYLSAAGLFQKQRGIDLSPVNPQGFGYTSWAFDVGGRYDLGDLEALGWYYRGEGVGTTALFNLANNPLNGQKRTSEGYLAQLTYKLGQTKLGANFGQSKLYPANGEVNGPLVSRNQKVTVGAYYSMTDNLTLTAELSYLWSYARSGALNESKNADVGAFLKF